MDDLTKRQDTIDAMRDAFSDWCKEFNAAIDHCIHHVIHDPTIEERKTGKWVYKTTDAYIQRTCSACGWSERMYYRNRNQDGLIRNYCPNCGAKMEEQK